MEGMLLTSIPLFKPRVIRAAAHQLLDCVQKSVRQIQSHYSNSSSLKDRSRLEKIEEIGGKDFDAYIAPPSSNNGLISGFKTILKESDWLEQNPMLTMQNTSKH